MRKAVERIVGITADIVVINVICIALVVLSWGNAPYAERTVNLCAVVPVGHINSPEALRVGIAVLSADKRIFTHLLFVQLTALLLGNFKGHNRVGLPLLADFVKNHRRSSAVLAKTDCVVFVGGDKLCSARRTAVNKAVKVRLGFCVIARAVVRDLLGIKAVMAVIARHLLAFDFKP